jgi:hypothetical protein
VPGLSAPRVVKDYVEYYIRARTHLSLEKDAPVPRSATPSGRVVAIPEVHGLHHRYTRVAA